MGRISYHNRNQDRRIMRDPYSAFLDLERCIVGKTDKPKFGAKKMEYEIKESLEARSLCVPV